MACGNHLKQLGLGLLNYEGTFKEFPRGVYSAPYGEDHEDGLAWGTRILPYIDQQPLYDLIARNSIPGYSDNPWSGGIFRAARANGMSPIAGGESVIETFLCPSADLPTVIPNGDYFHLKGGFNLVNTGYGGASYKGSRGPCDRGMFWRTEEGLKVGVCSLDYNGDGTPELIEKSAYQSIRLNNIPDGTSRTICIGEAAYFPNPTAFPVWIGASANEDGAVLFKTENLIGCNVGGSRVFPLSKSEIDRMPDKSKSDDCAFSWHTGGAQFGYVDGSVHFLSENIQLRIFYLLGDRLDNMPLPEVD